MCKQLPVNLINEAVAMSASIAERAAGYPWPHRDPFDRIVFATAELGGLAFLPWTRLCWSFCRAERDGMAHEVTGFPGRLPRIGLAARLNDAAPSGCM